MRFLVSCGYSASPAGPSSRACIQRERVVFRLRRSSLPERTNVVYVQLLRLPRPQARLDLIGVTARIGRGAESLAGKDRGRFVRPVAAPALDVHRQHDVRAVHPYQAAGLSAGGPGCSVTPVAFTWE